MFYRLALQRTAALVTPYFKEYSITACLKCIFCVIVSTENRATCLSVLYRQLCLKTGWLYALLYFFCHSSLYHIQKCMPTFVKSIDTGHIRGYNVMKRTNVCSVQAASQSFGGGDKTDNDSHRDLPKKTSRPYSRPQTPDTSAV